MTKTKRARVRAVKKDEHGLRLLKVLRATGLFRWEKPSTKSEEVVNILTHGIGIGLAIAALTLLVVFAGIKGDAWAIVSCAIFGVTMITLYFGSTMCHATIGKKHECFFEVWDSVAIYALIAGTYTPFLLVNLRGIIGWTVFGILWAIVLFVAMGWTLLFILPAMIRNIPMRGLWFILAGGLSYTIGVIFYLWRRMKFSHAVWHLFVIGGTVCFFFAVLFGCILDL